MLLWENVLFAFVCPREELEGSADDHNNELLACGKYSSKERLSSHD